MPVAIAKQFPSGFLVAALLTASGLMWAVMFFGPLAHLTRLAGGLTPFDVRLRGYSFADARAFLEAIGEQGRAYYANPELILDTFYPPLYAVSRGLALWWLTMPGRIRTARLEISTTPFDRCGHVHSITAIQPFSITSRLAMRGSALRLACNAPTWAVAET
jgi:hypothetical protein